jgi:phosphoglycerate dehydrogenase-like enzyme
MKKLRIVATQCGQGRTKYHYDRFLFDRLARKHQVWINPKDGFDLTVDDLKDRIADADVLIAGWGSGHVPGEVYAYAEKLKQVCLIGASIKPISPEQAWERGVVITNTAPSIGKSVAEFVLGEMLRWLHPYERYDQIIKAGTPWQQARESMIQRDLGDVTVGLVGCGATVRYLAPVLMALKTRVLAYDPFVDRSGFPGVEFVDDLITLMAGSDIVSLHAGMTPETRHLIGHTELAARRRAIDQRGARRADRRGRTGRAPHGQAHPRGAGRVRPRAAARRSPAALDAEHHAHAARRRHV